MISSQTAEHEREQRDRLAAAIEDRKTEIERRWLETVRAGVDRDNIRLTELRNAMPDYLSSLIHALREESGSVEKGGTAAWAVVAREHAITRVRLGFEIEQLVHEFVALRQILFDVVREEGVVGDERQTSRLADLIESAIAAAVKSYVDSRDYAARRVEAEHIGFVTHELRNPLTTANLMASRLRKTLSLEPAEEREFQILIRSLDRLGELIDGVLLVEKFDAKEVRAAPREVTLGEILDAALESARASAAAKEIDLVVELDSDVIVRADSALTRSVVANLLDNAVKYTDEGVVRLVASDALDHVAIHVYDNCEGLSAEELKTIFEPFRRGAHSDKPGTGLGLAIARRAVEAQGGSIAAESADERGCHFWFTLPKARH